MLAAVLDSVKSWHAYEEPVADVRSPRYVAGVSRRAGAAIVLAPDTALVVVLGAVAGCVDAITFSRVLDVFPANQSGNAVLLGIDLGMVHGGAAWRPAIAIVGFGLGVTVGILLGGRLGPHRTAALLAAETVLLLPLLLVVAFVRHPHTELASVPAVALVAVTAAAMGIQTEVIGRAAGTAVATTYQSGAITRIAESAAARISPATQLRAGTGVAVGVLALVLTAYVGGAALGAALGSWSAAVVIPVGALVVTAVASVGLRLGAPDRPRGDG